MRFLLALAAAAGLSIPTAASAQMGGRPFDWSGFYIGGHGSYVSSDTRYVNPATPTQSFDGAMLGGQIGYNFQFGRVVAGAEADISFGQLKDFVRDGNLLTYNGKITQMGTIRARLGYDFNGFMPYITAGWMWNRLEQGSTCPAGAPFPVVTVCNIGQFNVASTETFSGFTIGGGAEYALSRNWSLKGEVLFSNFGKQQYTATLPVLGSVTTPVNQDFNYAARVGVNYRF